MQDVWGLFVQLYNFSYINLKLFGKKKFSKINKNHKGEKFADLIELFVSKHFIYKLQGGKYTTK